MKYIVGDIMAGTTQNSTEYNRASLKYIQHNSIPQNIAFTTKLS